MVISHPAKDLAGGDLSGFGWYGFGCRG